VLTGIGLNPSGDLSSTDIVKKCDILAKNGSEIRFTKTFCSNFRGVRPYGHEDEIRNEHAETLQRC